MELMQRRAVLRSIVGVGIGGFSGCAGVLKPSPPDSDDDGVPDKDDDYPENEDAYAKSGEKSAIVEITDEKKWSMGAPTGDTVLNFDIRVEEGPAVTVRVFGPTEYKKYVGLEDGEALPTFIRRDVREIEGEVTAMDIFDQGAAFYIFVESDKTDPRKSVVDFKATTFR